MTASAGRVAVTLCSGMAGEPLLRTCTPGYADAPARPACTWPSPGLTVNAGVTTTVVERESRPPTLKVRLDAPSGASWPAPTPTHITVVPGSCRSPFEKVSEVPSADRLPG